jgi:hypothetical protein
MERVETVAKMRESSAMMAIHKMKTDAPANAKRNIVVMATFKKVLGSSVITGVNAPMEQNVDCKIQKSVHPLSLSVRRMVVAYVRATQIALLPVSRVHARSPIPPAPMMQTVYWSRVVSAHLGLELLNAPDGGIPTAPLQKSPVH